MADPRTWSDRPISGAAEDDFERSGYATRAADLIVASRSPGQSTVFGMIGPWGSGKTSLIEMIVERLREHHGEWQVARFTPWSSGDVNGLLSEFYASLTAALPRDHRRAVRKSLSVLLQIAAPAATLVPLAGTTAAGAIDATGRALARSVPWDEAFQKAAVRLQAANVPLLVIADDVDRLQADELAALLKVVRLLGRFPGVQYLLAYDEQTLGQTLSASWGVEDDGRTAGQFMEKIVQYPLTVPPLLDHQLLERLDKGIDQTMRQAGREVKDFRRLSNLTDLLPALLSTPRAVDRFLAQLRHHVVLIDAGEINDEDVILLELVRTSFPRLHAALPRWKTRLIQGKSGELDHSSSEMRWKPVSWDLLLQAVPAGQAERARRLLAELFPHFSTDEYRLTDEGGERRACDEHYFDRYFAMSILSNDVSDAALLESMAKAKEGSGESLRAVLLGQNDFKATLAITKLARMANFEAPGERLAALAVLSAIVDGLDDGLRILSVSERSRMITWMASIIIRLESHVPDSSIVHGLSRASLVSQLQVWMEVAQRIETEIDQPAWLNLVSETMIESAVDAFLTHLDAQDEAPLDEPASFYASSVIKLGGAARLRKKVSRAIGDGDVTLEDLAARLISKRWVVGADAPPTLKYFDRGEWAALAPGDDDPWYRRPIEEVDPEDMSWESRRRFARGRVRPHGGDVVGPVAGTHERDEDAVDA